MLDVPNGIERGLLDIDDTIDIHRGGTHKAMYTYVQDKWQLRPDVTLDLGLRHELYFPLVGYTPVGGQATYDPETNIIRVAGYGDIPEDLGVKMNWKNFGPRTGISWRPNDATVLRAGYGVSALGLPSSWGQAYPIRQVQQITPANSFAPTTVNLATGMPLPALVPIPASGILDATPLRAEALDVIDPNRTEGTLHSFNVAYQRILPGGFTAEIAYVGNRGHDIMSAYNMNAGLVIGADNAGRPLFTKYQRTADTSSPQPTKSEYNSMQVKLDRRMRNGLLLTNSYTFGTRLQLLERRRRRHDLHPGGSGARLSADDVRLDAQLRQQFRLHASMGTGRQVDARGRDRKSARRLAGDGSRVGHLWHANRLYGECRRPARTRQLEYAQCHGNAGRARRYRIGRPLVRHVRVFGARQYRVGQRRAARASDRSGVLQP